MEYAFAFENHGTFTPSGRQEISDVGAHNRELERMEIEMLKSHPDRLFLYVRMHDHLKQVSSAITTWLGTVVSERCFIGYRVNVGFGMHTYRRSVDCTIFGVRYVGWYMESSGSYCRLRKAKQQ
jgi:hypothetical protein